MPADTSAAPATPSTADQADAGLALWDLMSIDRQLKAAGLSLAHVLSWAASAGFGVTVWPETAPEGLDVGLEAAQGSQAPTAPATGSTAS